MRDAFNLFLREKFIYIWLINLEPGFGAITRCFLPNCNRSLLLVVDNEIIHY